MTRVELLEVLGAGENSAAEFKRDDIQPEQLAKEIVALLNFRGGHILLGVEDNGTVSGIVRHDLEEWVMNVSRDCLRPAIIPVFEVIPFDQTRKVAVITLRPDSPDKPYQARRGGHWIYFVRVGTTSREASREEVQRLCQGLPLFSGPEQQHIIPEAARDGEEGGAARDDIENPYNIAKPATRFFRGREPELQRLQAVLKEGKSAVVFGLQRIGKTSLVEKVLTEEINKPAFGRTITCLQINMFSAWESFDTDLHFILAILDELVDKGGGPKKAKDPQKAKDLIREILAASSSDIERERKVRHLLREGIRRTHSSLLLFIDEFHDIEKAFERARVRRTPNPVDAGLLRRIGSLVKDGTLQLLICCRYKAIPMEREEGLELFKLLDEINLGVLDEKSARSLIRDPVARRIKYEEQSIRKILQLTGGHPYLIQYLCSELVRRFRVKRSGIVRMRDAEECAEEITSDPIRESKFHVLYADFRKMEGSHPWRVLLALAENAEFAGKLIGKNEVVATFREWFGSHYHEGNIKRWMDTLVLSQVVGEEKRGVVPSYFIRPDMLRLWLRNQRYLDQEV